MVEGNKSAAGGTQFFSWGRSALVFSEKLAARYQELKEEAEGFVLLMQVGAFMQVMDEDARTVSAVTGLKLKMAGDVDSPVVVGGFPRSGLDAYVGKLTRAGHSVAIAFQGPDKERMLSELIKVERVPASGRSEKAPAEEEHGPL